MPVVENDDDKLDAGSEKSPYWLLQFNGDTCLELKLENLYI